MTHPRIAERITQVKLDKAKKRHYHARYSLCAPGVTAMRVIGLDNIAFNYSVSLPQNVIDNMGGNTYTW